MATRKSRCNFSAGKVCRRAKACRSGHTGATHTRRRTALKKPMTPARSAFPSAAAATLDEVVENIGPRRRMQRQPAFAHMAVVVAMLRTDQIGIGSDEDAELANRRRALTFPDVEGIGMRGLGAPGRQGHEERRIDAIGAEAGNHLEQVLAILPSAAIADGGVALALVPKDVVRRETGIVQPSDRR